MGVYNGLLDLDGVPFEAVLSNEERETVPAKLDRISALPRESHVHVEAGGERRGLRAVASSR